jgi:uncharacterized protein (TIGR03437 family)
VFRLGPALAVLLGGIAWGAAPSYSLAGIVSTGSYAPGPFAPNSLITIFGSGLAIGPRGMTPADIVKNVLPDELNSTRVFIDNYPVPLFYVSENQINLLIPAKQGLGRSDLVVVREGQRGPVVSIEVAPAAPALFVDNGYAIATHGDSSLITADKPARPGELIVVYAAGLGRTATMPGNGELVPWLSPLADLGSFRVTLGGAAVAAGKIYYAGLTPQSAGLYQVNFWIPETVGSDPEVRLFVGDTGSPAGVKLRVPGSSGQLSAADGR